MTLYERARSVLLGRRARIGIPAVLQALAVLPVLACAAPAAPAAHAGEHRYRPVQVTHRTATFAVGDLAHRSIVSARLTATGGRSSPVALAGVRRAVTGSRARSGRLRLRIPRSWRRARSEQRPRMTLRVHTEPRCDRALSPSFGTVLWKADAESSMASEWASSSSMPAASSPANPDPTRISRSSFRVQGKRSYRFAVRDGDDSYGERAELGQAMPAAASHDRRWFRAGEERWIAMRYYLPTDWPDDSRWQTVFQIKPILPGGGGPNIGLDAGANALTFYGNSSVWGSTAGTDLDGAGPRPGGGYPLTRGRWIRLTWHIVFSADPAAGSVEAFGDLADGKGMRTLVPRRSRATMKSLHGAAVPAHLRVGIYRDPAITGNAHLFVDGLTVATTRAAAEANACGGA